MSIDFLLNSELNFFITGVRRSLRRAFKRVSASVTSPKLSSVITRVETGTICAVSICLPFFVLHMAFYLAFLASEVDCFIKTPTSCSLFSESLIMVSMLAICLPNKFMRLRSDNTNVSNKKIDIPSIAVTNAISEI